MKRILKHITTLTALLLAVVFIFPTDALAVYVIGSSGSPGSSGTNHNADNCGLAAQYMQSFRVGLSRDPMGAPLKDSDAPDTLKRRLETQYQTRYPDNGYRSDNWPINFLPYNHSGIQTLYNRGVRYTDYNPAAGDLNAYNDPNVAANTMICSGTKLTGSTGVYYSQLKTKLGSGTRIDALLSYWKTIATNKTSSLNYWSYIMEPQGTNNNYTYLITERMREKLNPNNIDLLSSALKEADRIDCTLRYIDMLMTLYTLCGANVRGVWETAINDFIKGEVLGEKPVYLIIDVVHCIQQGSNSPLYITSSIDYLQYITGVDAANDMTSKNFKGSPAGTFVAGQTGTGSVYKSVIGWFKQAVDASINNGSNKNRLSSLPKVPTTNGWAWGATAIVHNGRPSTKSNNGIGGLLNFYYYQWRTAGMEALWFPTVGAVPGFCIAGAEFAGLAKQNAAVDIGFTIKASPKNKEVTGPIGVPASLGENVTIEVDLTQSSAALDAWKKRLANVSSVDVTMSLKETPENHTLSCVTDSRFSGAALNGSTKVTLSKDDFLKLLSQRIMFEDRVSDVQLSSEESVLYTYTFGMTVQFKENNDTISVYALTKDYTGDKATAPVSARSASDYASFFRAKDPPVPEYIKYTSMPETPYSEIKQGTIGNEAFEAMAGVPTTRDLYFSVGGSEFIVDMFGELKKEQTATRTYRVHYDGTACEFKDPDDSKTHSLGGVTVNTHSGGSYTAATTWSGNHSHTQNPTSCATCGASGYNACTVNTSAYDAAMTAATAYAAEINGTVLSWTAGSDGQTRTKSGWGAAPSATSDTASTATAPSGGSGCLHGGSCSIVGTKESPHQHSGGNCSAGSSCGSSHAWRIVVLFSVPQDCICGPCCRHDLPAIDDTWTQEIEYDYFQLQKATVWKLDQGYLNGLQTITGAYDSTLARVVQGDPTIFYNIAQTETSRNGRFRYSVEPQQHDAVTWNKGARTNKCNKQDKSWGTGILYTNTAYPHEAGYLEANTSAKDKLTDEYAEYLRNRETLVEATVISDYLILQTSSGDQSVLYFDKKSNTVQTQQDYDPVPVTLEEGWDNNPNSAANWTPEEINKGSYNGRFAEPANKYKGSGSGNRVATIFDNDPARTVTRTARPSVPLHVAKYNIDILDTNPNGEYPTGTAKAFWRVILDHNPENRQQPYSVDAQPLFGNQRGHVLDAPYSPSHTKINDILIHDPVSVEYAMLLPLDNTRDQRVEASKGKAVQLTQAENGKCPGNPADCEYRELNCKYVGTHYHTANCYTIPTPYTLNSHDHSVSCVNSSIIQQAFNRAVYDFSFSGSVQTFAAPISGYYTLEAWGAQGGGYPNNTSDGGYGGYSKSVVHLSKGQQIQIYVGGRGGNAPQDSIDRFDGLNNNGGYNGGGSGSGSHGPGGGGRTDIRYGSGAEQVYVVAAGGGGGYRSSGSDNPNSNGSYFYGSNGGTDRGGSSYPRDNGGGGGGYYGGQTVLGDDPSYGYAGTNYCTGSGATNSYGVRAGNGYARITCNDYLQGDIWGLVDFRSLDNGSGSYTVTNAWVAKQAKDAPIFKCGGMPYTRHICNASCSHTAVLKCNEPHHRGEHYDTGSSVCWNACHNDAKHAQRTAAPSGSVASGKTAGDFINLDWGFQIYYPNTGDFNQGEPYGLSAVTAQRGKGFVDNMDTTEWIAQKRVRFMFDVIYCGATNTLNVDGSQHGNSASGGDNHKHTAACTLYRAGTWIDLTGVKQYSLYNFYCVGSNAEAAASKVTYEVVDINAPGEVNDNTETTNRLRDYSLRAKHGAVKSTYIDVVGRIGNLVMEDTGDFRFSNLFKTPVAGNDINDWLVQGIVKKVDITSKNYVLSTLPDIRGLSTSFGQNTYGVLPWLNDGKNLSFPLSPDKNNITALKDQAISFGYPVYLDLNTLGKDYQNIEVIPHYYYFDLDTGQVSPLDVYMEVSAGNYQAINRFGIVQSGWDQSSVYPYKYTLDWTNESARRNVTTAEAALTQRIIAAGTGYYADDEDSEVSAVPMDAPAGSSYALGTAQMLSFGERARTFIGSTQTMGVNQNLGGVLAATDFEKAAKRWHFTLGLPSSAVVVDAGAELNDTNIQKYKAGNGVVLMTASIKATGDQFTLEYKLPSNGTFNIGGRTYALPNGIPNVIAVYNGARSSKDDLAIRKTH